MTPQAAQRRDILTGLSRPQKDAVLGWFEAEYQAECQNVLGARGDDLIEAKGRMGRMDDLRNEARAVFSDDPSQKQTLTPKKGH